jgi:D-alanyl-D-alanine carboxypeptidase/D-alanyl-D-alanine-endopeptidase (penicillin-binding protein 4)
VPEDTVVYLSGEIPLGNRGQYLWIAVQNPALFLGRAFQKALQDVGIEVAGVIVVDRGTATEPGTPLFTYLSPPLFEVIKLMNKESDNFVSESVLRALGVRINACGDLRSSLDAEARFLRELGIGEAGIELRDGCGLARQDLVSARGLVELFKAMYVHPSSDAYIASMAVSGVDGTIGFRMSAPEMIGKVHAKTGSINHVSNLAGYLFGENGQVFLFAILCNNFPSNRRQNVRGVQDAILERLYSVTADNYSTTDH